MAGIGPSYPVWLCQPSNLAGNELDEPLRSAEAFILGMIPNTEKLDKFTVALKEYVGTWTYILKGWA
jgi:hypothetical protein